MQKIIVFFALISSLFSIDKYKDEQVLSKWEVNEGKITLIESKTIDNIGSLNKLSKQQELWDIISYFLPKEIIDNKIKKFIVFSDNTPDNFKGMYGLIEAVPGSSNSSFVLSIDINDSFENNKIVLQSFLPLLMHEFFHIISLDSSQLSREKNNNYRIFEGYTKTNSYLNIFKNKFWNNALGNKLIELESNYSIKYLEKHNMKENIYKNHEDDFVSAYAMTNPVEDIACSFEAFVSEPQFVLGDSLKDRKISFFYSFKELVDYKIEFNKKKKELIKKYGKTKSIN